MSLNKIFIIGNLGCDPILKHTATGQPQCKFSVATTEVYYDKEKKKVDKTTWHNVVVWGKSAENCNKYLSKGKKVLVEGKIDNRSWEDKEGKKCYMTEIVASNVQFLSAKSDGTSPDQNQEQSSMQDSGQSFEEFCEMDIPF